MLSISNSSVHLSNLIAFLSSTRRNITRKVMAPTLAVPHGRNCCWCRRASRGRICTSTVSPSLWCDQARDQRSERDVSPDPSSERELTEKLWREFFSDPFQWWDHRYEKVNPRDPDFKHKGTGQSLCITDTLTPPWVKVELAAARDCLPDSISGRKMRREKLWREFLSDPSQLCDNRSEKVNPTYPDFKHKRTVQGLWIDNRSEKVKPRYPDFKHKRTGQGLWIFDDLAPSRVKAEMATEHHCPPDPLFNQKKIRENLWRDFFSDPAQWWDNRSEKVNPRYPDFKHKKTGLGLWLDNSLTPPWVEAELATMAPSLLQLDIFSWRARLRRHLQAGEYKETLNRFKQMQQEGMIPDKFTLVAVLNACSNLGSFEEGRRVHQQIIHTGCETDIYVDNCLVDMYAKCGSIEDAWTVFKKMRERDSISWNAMIGGYAKYQQGLTALELFRQMQQEGVEPDAVTFVGVLNACASIAALKEGRRVHQQIIQRGWESNVHVATCLVDMYAKCGTIEDAWRVFDNMRDRDVVSWTAMIVGYVRSGQGLKALELFQKMGQEGVEPNTVTFVGVLNACASVMALEEGKRAHEQIIRRGCESDVYVATCLVDMYAKCGSIEDALSVFKKMHGRTVVSWGAMIVGYVKSEQGLKALELFQNMQQEGVEPDAVTFVGALNACASIAALEEGRRVHKQIIERGYESDVYVATCIVDMYAKCGNIEDAWSVFNKMRERTVVSWSAMIVGYVKSEQGLKALELFQDMRQQGVDPNTITFVGALNACANVGVLEEGRHVHEQIIQRGYESNVYIATCLVDMYAKCGSIEDAWSVFNKMKERDVVSWNAMIAGCVKSEQGLKALELFQKMQQEGMEPDAVTFIGALNACATVVALRQGRRVHKQIIRRGYESDFCVATCLVDMYAKCGSTKDARTVFNKMRERDVVSWSAMIGGYAMHGHSQKAIELFERMGKEGVEINEITFICLLSACSHGGLVEKGLHYFNTMMSHYNVLPKMEHYVCMVDLLGRAGWLEEAESMAEEMTKRMPMKRDSCVWRCLLGACRIHGNLDMAERAARRCLELDPRNASAHVLLSNTYAAAGQWDRSAAVEEARLKGRLWKVPARSWIEVKNVVHSFVVDDEEHPGIWQIRAEFDKLSVQLNQEGYVSDRKILSPEIEEKECHLCGHHEKRAIARGLVVHSLSGNVPAFS